MVTPALFERFPTLEAFTQASAEEIEPYIRSCGLYKTKARDIYAMCNMLKEKYDGVIPDTVEELTKLPGDVYKRQDMLIEFIAYDSTKPL